MKVELVEVTAQTVPITLHHVHFFGQQNTEMQAWYVKVFGAKAALEAAEHFPTPLCRASH